MCASIDIAIRAKYTIDYTFVHLDEHYSLVLSLLNDFHDGSKLYAAPFLFLIFRAQKDNYQSSAIAKNIL
jgi:hypothetical protein